MTPRPTDTPSQARPSTNPDFWRCCATFDGEAGIDRDWLEIRCVLRHRHDGDHVGGIQWAPDAQTWDDFSVEDWPVLR